MRETLSVPAGHALAGREEALEALELREPEGAEDVGEAVVEAGRVDVRRMPRGDPVVPQAADHGRELRLVGRHGAPFAGRDDLARVEREAGEQPERAARRSAVARPEC